ncbi:hypothetical protein PPYR_08596 [Photinus pyralis]|uniref:Uncharacterized protein n=2 Tax=Photinus pyralis TaxID=7054 RepID=A0A5N4AJZ3_PHOPY|nr:hypothetical protein PPYR_08596 [Photinus pyralis]
METLTQPKPMSMSGDLGKNWKIFKEDFNIYLLATGGTEKSRKVQAAILMHCMGRDAKEVLNTLEVSDTEKEDPTAIMKSLDDYFIPKTNTSVERHKFNTRVQLPCDCFVLQY